MATGRGEMQAEVCSVVQIAWHLNKLPGGTPGLKDINSDELDLFPLSMGLKEKRACPQCTKQCLGHICRS